MPGIIDAIMNAANSVSDGAGKLFDAAGSAVDWSAKATPDKDYSEGMQDAARHTDWMANTSLLIQEAAKRGLMTEDVRRLMGENPAAALEMLARGMGQVAAIGGGAAMEVPGMLQASGQAGKRLLQGDASGAGGIMREAIDSAKMDLNNNAAGAITYSQIADPVARRQAIQAAATSAPVTQSPALSAQRPFDGTLVRRR